jgi:hypothetical protein
MAPRDGTSGDQYLGAGRVWGVGGHAGAHNRTFTIVEDGDRKGFQSTKGKQAKEEMKITPLILPLGRRR